MKRWIFVFIIIAITVSCKISKYENNKKSKSGELTMVSKNPILTEKEARALATKLAQQKASKIKLYNDNGEQIHTNHIPTSNWITVYKKDGKWHLGIFPPSGVSTSVTFNLDGSDPKVKIQYSSD